MSIEFLEIQQCPKCNDGHRYRIDVERSLVLHLATSRHLTEPQKEKKFTRLFTCPTKNEDFQASFILTYTSSDIITAVDVLGMVENSKDE